MATATGTSQFTGVDFLDFDSLLSEEERAIRDTVRTWVDENLIPVIGQAYVEGKFPKQLIPGMASWGCLAPICPRSTGARGSTTWRTGSSCRSWSAATAESARSPRCRALW